MATKTPLTRSELLVMAAFSMTAEQARVEWLRIAGLVNLFNTGQIAPVCAAHVIVKAANLRAGPGKNYSIIKQLSEKDYLHVWGQTPDGQWLCVADDAGDAGWLYHSLLEKEPS